MANLPSTFSYVNDVEVTQDAPVTEALEAKGGSNDNYLRDAVDSEIIARAAGDAVNAASIVATNATVTTLTGRVNNAKNVLKLGSTHVATDFTNPLLSLYFMNATAGDNYKILYQDPVTFALTLKLDTLVPVSNTIFAEYSSGSNGVNNFLQIKLFEITSV